MDITITGINATDRMELRREPEFKGTSFTEDDRHGNADMGVFSVGVPVTLALISVLKTWIKKRDPSTKVVFSDTNDQIIYETKGKKADPDELGRILEQMRSKDK
jgi:hypothetical protein